MRRRAGEHAARPGVLLESRRHVGRIADRRVVHPEVIADATHDDRTRVEADPHLEGPLEPWGQFAAQVTDSALDREGGVRGAPGRVLVRDGRPEQGHDAVAGVLVDRALEPMHLARDRSETPINDRVDLLGIARLGEGAEARQVGEQHRHLTPLALERGPGLEDLVREVLRRVVDLGAGSGLRHRRRAGRLGNELMSTLVAKPTPGEIRMRAGRADAVQADAASATELRGRRVLGRAARAVHRRLVTIRRIA